MVLSMKMTGRFIVVNIYIKPWHCYDKPQSVTITNLCVTQSVWFAPAYVGYRIFFPWRGSVQLMVMIAELELSYVVEYTLMKVEEQNCVSF